MAVLAKLVLVSTAQAKRHYRKAKALLVIGNHPIKTHQLVAWYHLLSRSVPPAFQRWDAVVPASQSHNSSPKKTYKITTPS